MGAVYEAEHLLLGTRVAIKVLHRELTQKPGIAERFVQEARVSARIRNPHIVQIHDVEQGTDGVVFIVMELLDGEPLGDFLHRVTKVSAATTIAFADQILEALECAHALPVVHRDLKPDNIFLVRPIAGSNEPLIKLIDFGIAKAVRHSADAASANLTMAGMVMGTAEYMAPEQAFSADQVDARSDLYSLGVILYEMLSGKRPLSGEDPRLIALRVERGDIPPLAQLAPDVPLALAAIVHRALSARKEQRFASASVMRAALRALRSGSGASIAAPVAQPARVGGIDAGVQTTGTVLGAPVPAALLQAAAPVPAAHIQDSAPVNMPYARAVTTPPRRRRTPMWPIAIVALLLGGAIVPAVLYLNSSEAEPVAIQNPAAVVLLAARPDAASPKETAVDPGAPLAQLTTLAGATAATPASTARPQPTLSKPSRPASPDAAPPQPTAQPGLFPLPTGFPTLPPGFPTFPPPPNGWPGFTPPAPAPTPP
jgi:eukaryotic-like serine/threonine-protein kinase